MQLLEIPSWSSAYPALLQGRGPDSPFGDLLGYLIIFFVIVWPILRGILEKATSQRKEFEERQKSASPRPTAEAPRRGRTLEDILEGKIDQYPAPPSAEIDFPPAEVQRQPRPKAPKVQPKPRSAKDSFGTRPASESSAPVYDSGDLFGDGSGGGELVGDPFDESSMGQDLVSDKDLRDVPSEDELEVYGGDAIGGSPMGRSGTTSASRHAGQRSSRSTGDAADRLQARIAAATEAPAANDPEAIFRRLPKRLTPWQKALILKEIMGAPVGSRPPYSQSDLLG